MWSSRLAQGSRFRLRSRTAFLASLGLSNYSEFGLIVASIAAANGWLADRWSRRNMMAAFYFGCGVSLAGGRVRRRERRDAPLLGHSMHRLRRALGRLGFGHRRAQVHRRGLGRALRHQGGVQRGLQLVVVMPPSTG